MKNKKKPQKISGGGVAALCTFAAPFLLWGSYSAWQFLGLLAEHSEMQSWIETPALIASVEVVDTDRSRGSGRAKRSKETYKVVVSYIYEFGGINYRGDRASLYTGSDGNAAHHLTIHHELQTHVDRGQPFRCFVNPDDPRQSVLYRDWRWNVSAIHAVHACLFGGLGLFLIGSSSYYWRKQ